MARAFEDDLTKGDELAEQKESASFVVTLLETDLDGLLKDIDQLASRLKPILPEERGDTAGPALGVASSSSESILVRRLNSVGRTITTARTLLNELGANVQP